MSSSAINQGVLSAKISNVQNAADSSAVYSAGAWSFKNSSAVTSVQIDNSGNVGIGTASPAQVLHISKNTAITALVENTTTTAQVALQVKNTAGSTLLAQDSVGGFLFTDSSKPFLFYTGGTERMRIDASGNLTLGTGALTAGPTTGTVELEHLITGYRTGGSSPACYIQNRSTTAACPALSISKGSADTTTGHRLITFIINNGSSGSGQINANGANACGFGTFSDRRLKENIVPLSGELEKVLALNPVEFDYIEGGHQVGFVAQEIEEIYPDAVSILGETDEMKMVTGWDKTTARLVKAIQELSAKVDAQAAEGAALRAEGAALRSEIEALKASAVPAPSEGA